jgi:superfamily II DNA or RNA helicase
MTRIFDNIKSNLGDHLAESVGIADRLDAAVGYFNLRGWRFFVPAVDAKPAGELFARILVGMATPAADVEVVEHLQAMLDGSVGDEEIDASVAKERRRAILENFREQLMRGVPTAADMATLRRLRAQLFDGRVQIKLFTARPLHGKTYICHRNDLHNPITAFVGSSNLTMAGLRHNYELNVDVLDDQGTERLSQWFEDRWADDFSLDISKLLIELIDESWASEEPPTPYEVYLKFCFHLSRDVREGLAEYSIPLELQRQLLDYQAQAVKTLARRIEVRGGAMLGDVVGLGKSITATAVAAMLGEVHEWDTLVICPPNLKEMWEKEYIDEYEISGRVVPFSMAEKILPTLRRYRFIIVDESHTMRNSKRKDYIALLDYIRRNDCKVLLLTATPFNIRFQDVANQVGLYIDDDDDLGLEPLAAMALDPQLADRVDHKTSTLAAFRRSEEAEDWKRLMSDHLVRRTRSFIRSTAPKDEQGREYLTFASGERFFFPRRLAKPLPHDFGETDPAALMASNHTLDTIAALRLPRYGLASYINPNHSPNPNEKKILESMRTASGHLSGFVRTGLYKRLSSCGYSFLLSLHRHIARNDMWLYAIDNRLDLPVGTVLDEMLVSTAEDDADPDASDGEGASRGSSKSDYEALASRPRPKVSWVSADLFTSKLRDDLEADTKALKSLIAEYGEWSHRRDSKIRALFDLVTRKHKGEKVLVFTEYADTAEYVGRSLQEMGVSDVAWVTGDTSDPTAFARRFSPESNRKQTTQPVDPADEVRVLVSTDVLSEGQNLQDAHIIVNFDLPWAIIRLIQRAGRVDRVGQKSDVVVVYSYFHDSVEAVLNLRDRIRHRLERNAEAFGSDEKFFGTDRETAVIQDLYDGTLEDLEGETDNDAASLAYEVWTRAKTEDPARADRIEAMPDMVFAIRPTRVDEEPAVAVYVRTQGQVDGFGVKRGGVLSLMTGHEALAFFECTQDTPQLPLSVGHFPAVQDLVRGPLKRPETSAGRLRGVRIRVWNRLNGALPAADVEVAEALDALYQRPLTGEAEQKLKMALRSADVDELAALVRLLHQQARLVLPDASRDPIRIVCSMGAAHDY